MKAVTNWESTEARESGGSFELIPIDVYEIEILRAVDIPDRERIEIEFDIVSGEYAGYFSKTASANYWGGKIYASYKERALPFFKGLLTSIASYYPVALKTKWDNDMKTGFDEKQLIGKKFHIVIGQEEYLAKDGSIKLSNKYDRPISKTSLQEKTYELPNIKPLPASKKPYKTSSLDVEDIEMDLEENKIPF